MCRWDLCSYRPASPLAGSLSMGGPMTTAGGLIFVAATITETSYALSTCRRQGTVGLAICGVGAIDR